MSKAREALAWMDKAECLESEDHLHTDAGRHAVAAIACRRCPVIFECRQWTLASKGMISGTWAGVLYKDGKVAS